MHFNKELESLPVQFKALIMEDENRAHINTHFSSTTRRQTPAVPTPNWDNEPLPKSRLQNDSRRQNEADKRKSDSLQSLPTKVQILEDMIIDSSNPKQLINDSAAVSISKSTVSKSILTKNHAKNPIYLQHPKSNEPSQIKKGFPFTFFVDSDEHKQQGSNNTQKLKPNKNPIIPLNSDSNVIPTKKTNKQHILAATSNKTLNTQDVSESTKPDRVMTNENVSNMSINLNNNSNNVTLKTIGEKDQSNKAVRNNQSKESNIQIRLLDSLKGSLHIDIPISEESRLELPIMANTTSVSIHSRLISPTNVPKSVESNVSFHRISPTHDVKSAVLQILSPPLESSRREANIDNEKVIRIQERKFQTISTSHEISEIYMKPVNSYETLEIIPKTPRNTESSMHETNCLPTWSDRKEVQYMHTEKNTQIFDKAQTILDTSVGTMPRPDILSEKWRAESHLIGSSESQIGQDNSIKCHPMPDSLVMSPFIVGTPLRHSTTEATGETRTNKEIISDKYRQRPVDASNRSETPSVISYHHTPRPFIPYTPKRIAGEVALTPSNSAYTPSFNPHSSMVPLTPIASGPSQAKNSIKLQNCVSTVSLGCELKLLEIYCRTRFSEYNPSRFHGVIMKILEPRATALVFRSGKIVCTGTRNEHDAYIATRKFARIIQKLGFSVRFLDFKIQNFIATADLRFPVRLEALQQAHGQFSSYEPEIFPGLVYRLVRPRVVLLIFVNGKIVFTGAKTREEISEALDVIYPILRSYKKN